MSAHEASENLMDRAWAAHNAERASFPDRCEGSRHAVKRALEAEPELVAAAIEDRDWLFAMIGGFMDWGARYGVEPDVARWAGQGTLGRYQ